MYLSEKKQNPKKTTDTTTPIMIKLALVVLTLFASSIILRQFCILFYSKLLVKFSFSITMAITN